MWTNPALRSAVADGRKEGASTVVVGLGTYGGGARHPLWRLEPSTERAFLNHATTESGRGMVTFSAEPIGLRSARLARNAAKIKHAPMAGRLYTAAPHVA